MIIINKNNKIIIYFKVRIIFNKASQFRIDNNIKSICLNHQFCKKILYLIINNKYNIRNFKIFNHQINLILNLITLLEITQ